MLRYRFLVLLLFCSSTALYGQKEADSLLSSRVFETIPEFPGGMEEVYEIIKRNIKYPKEEYKQKIGGVVKAAFTIDTLGNIINIKIIQSVSENIDKEAVRVIGLLNGWKPGTQNGKKVKVTYSMPITFHIRK